MPLLRVPGLSKFSWCVKSVFRQLEKKPVKKNQEKKKPERKTKKRKNLKEKINLLILLSGKLKICPHLRSSGMYRFRPF